LVVRITDNQLSFPVRTAVACGLMLNGWFPARRFLPYLTTEEIRALPDKENTVVIQPVAAIEQHGPHLPVAVDSAIVCGVLGRALDKLDPALPCYCLPPLCYGKSNEHVDFPGTITLPAVTLLDTLLAVCTSLYRSGFRKVAIVNSHGGQPQIVQIAARDARERHRDLSVFPLFVWSVPNCGGEFYTPREAEYGIHAGIGETALLLALLPDQVKMDRAVAEYPPERAAGGMLSIEGPVPYAWLTHDLSTSGVIGDPRGATPEMGEKLLDSLASGWVRVIDEIHRFCPPNNRR
jgi:creatinine amidohydrolase